MDPLQALRDSAEALGVGDFDRALERLFAYYQWRVKGGFEPDNININGKRGDDHAETLANQILDYMPKREARK